MNPRCAPQRVLAAHPPDQRSNLGIDPWTAADVAGLPAPVGAETASVPADHGLRLDDDDGFQERRVQSIQHTNSKRSMFHSLTRVGDLRRKTASCWRRRRFSASSRARLVNRDRIASSSWVRNVTIRPLHYHTPTRESSRIRFSGGTTPWTSRQAGQRSRPRLRSAPRASGFFVSTSTAQAAPSQEQMEVLRLVLFRHIMKMRQFAILDLERGNQRTTRTAKSGDRPPDRFAP